MTSPVSEHSGIDRKPSWRERMIWAIDIAEALAYLEHHSFYHGNLRTTCCYLFLEDSTAFDFMNDDDDSDIEDNTSSPSKRSSSFGSRRNNTQLDEPKWLKPFPPFPSSNAL